MRHPKRFAHLLPLLALACSLLAVTGVSGRETPTAELERLGVSTERLARLDAALAGYVARGELPGVVVQVNRAGETIYLGAHGWRDIENQVPMSADTLFRIASQTKAIIAVGTLSLQEEGRLLIGDPVADYLPEFSETTVAVPREDGGYDVVPAHRPITIRDLLMHTSGVGYGYGPAADRWAEAGIQGWYFADREEPIRETVRRMAELPFEAQPGEAWVYGYNTDILGALVEVVSGQPLDEFLRERVFEPLGMHDTHFYLPPAKAERLATVYGMGDDGQLFRAPDESHMTGQGEYVDGPRQSFSGGAGLLSTAHDYARFLEMLRNGGELEGARVLAPNTVRLMTVDHLPGTTIFPWRAGMGIGLGFRVRLDVGGEGVPSTQGEFGWGGAYHSVYWVDPAEQLVVTYFTQVIPSGDLDDHDKLRVLIYQALVAPPR